MKPLLRLAVCVLAMMDLPVTAAAQPCGDNGVQLQVLGAGGPELDDGRASSGYLLWRDGHARVLIDMGPGTMVEFDRSHARVEDLDLLLLTHFHVDHSADLAALIKGSYFTDRQRDLPLYGPAGNRLMPAATDFVTGLFGPDSKVYRYLSDYLSGGGGYRLLPHNVSTQGHEPVRVVAEDGLKVTAIPVHHGPIPALAWRIDADGRSVVISGDMNGDYHTLEKLAAGVDLLVAHHAIPEGTTGVARKLHMPPSVIGQIAGKAEVGRLVLSHRMRRTLGREAESERLIRDHYAGPLAFADDGQCFQP